MKQKMRGIWIPVEIWQMFLEKDIGSTELHLLATIDSLVTPEKGCFASNKYLGDLLNVRPDYIARLISKLKAKGLLNQIKFDGRRRYLETVWSRVEGLDRNTKADLDRCPTPLSPTGKDKQKDHSGGFGFEGEAKHEPFDKLCAIELKSTTKRSKTKLPKTWADHFRLLRTKDKKTKAEIEEALNWYCENYQDKWTPKCYTPKIFREKFERVVAAMKRSMPEPVEIEITDETKRIVERLKSNQWPKGSEHQLPTCVQKSLSNYETTRTQIIEIANATDPESETNSQDRLRMTRKKNLLNHLINILPAPSHFVQTWFEDIWNQINGWEAWGGNLETLSFRPSSRKFEGYFVGLVVGYGRNENEAKVLLKGIKIESDQTRWWK